MTSGVVQEGYELNVPVTVADGSAPTTSLLRVDASNIIIDTVKAAEDGSGNMILRLYESVNTATDARMTLHIPALRVFLCDMLENKGEEAQVADGKVLLHFHGFEVKTLRISR